MVFPPAHGKGMPMMKIYAHNPPFLEMVEWFGENFHFCSCVACLKLCVAKEHLLCMKLDETF